MGFLLIRNIVLMMLFFALTMAVTESSPATPNIVLPLSKWVVHIANKMETGGELFLHCKSKDNDLGIQNIPYNREFSFEFRVNFWRTTLFWCYFRSSFGEASVKVFWSEKTGSWLQDHCDTTIVGLSGECIWFAGDIGIYMGYIGKGGYDFVSEWNNTSMPEDDRLLLK